MTVPVIVQLGDGTNVLPCIGATVDLSASSPSTGSTVAAGSPIGGLSGYRSMAVWASLFGGTGGTLDVYLQASFDGGANWVDIGHWAQLAAAQAQTDWVVVFSRGFGSGTPVSAHADVNGVTPAPTIAAGTFTGGDWGDRVRLVFKTGAGVTLGHAQTVKLFLSP